MADTTPSDSASTSPIDPQTLIHDLRNGLAPIATCVEIIRKGNSPGDHAKALNIISSQIELLTAILNQHSKSHSNARATTDPTPASSPPTAPAPEKNSTRSIPESVLLIDDNPNIIASLKMLFEDRGYEVFAAIKAEDAVELAAQFKPEICLCDISLPTMDGFAAASELLQAHPAMRLYSMSGWGEPSDRQQSREAGFLAHFIKPISFDEMFSLIESQTDFHL